MRARPPPALPGAPSRRRGHHVDEHNYPREVASRLVSRSPESCSGAMVERRGLDTGLPAGGFPRPVLRTRPPAGPSGSHRAPRSTAHVQHGHECTGDRHRCGVHHGPAEHLDRRPRDLRHGIRLRNRRNRAVRAIRSGTGDVHRRPDARCRCGSHLDPCHPRRKLFLIRARHRHSPETPASQAQCFARPSPSRYDG
jgi:hypothetical protein